MLPYLKNLRFAYENKLFLQIQMHPVMPQLRASLSQKPDMLHFRKRQLLGVAVKITRALLPELHALYQTCLAFVGDQLEGELYVQQQSDYNASVYAVGNRFDILVSSAIIKDFKPEEIAFVIGHELGHVVFEHQQIPVGQILAECQQIPFQLASLLFQWSRTAEISADRIGLLCSGSLMSAANAFFKTSSGLLLDRESEIIRSLRAQYDELAKLSTARRASNDWICTHPLIPIRFKSLEMICLDILALRNQKTSKMKMAWGQVDAEIERALLNTEPLAPKEIQLTREGLAVLMLAMLYIAASDGELHPAEEGFINEVHGRIAAQLEVAEILAICKQNRQRFRERALLDMKRVHICRDDAVVILELGYYLAVADQPFCHAERQALEEVCDAFNCERMLVETIISERESGE